MNKGAIIDKILESTYCGDLFERNEKSVTDIYRGYVKEIHPDICDDPRACDAFGKLTKLHDRAIENLRSNTWEESNVFWLSDNTSMQYRECLEFEIGKRYSSDDSVIWEFDEEKSRYALNSYKSVMLIDFFDNKMRQTYESRIPKIGKSFVSNSRSYIRISKKSNEYPMDLFLKRYGNKLDGRDIAWMISRMVDLCCFLKTQGLVHNGICKENLWINSDSHMICLYGGWWYAVQEGEKMIGTTRDIFNLMPTRIRTSKLADSITDMECVRAMFRKIAKDIPDGYVPKEIRKWIDEGSTSDPINEYVRWNETLDKAYGCRKFKVFSAKADEIYQK